MFLIKKSKYVTGFSVAYFFVVTAISPIINIIFVFLLFFYPYMLEYSQSSFSIATCAVVGTFITDMTICSVNM